jgi:hypothetical protein
MQMLMITSVTRHQQWFSTRNTKVNGRNNAAPITQGMIGLRMCVVRSLLNNPRYIFIVRRLSIVSKLDSNNPYRIWAELYFPNLNNLNQLDAWPIQPYRHSHKTRFTS